MAETQGQFKTEAKAVAEKWPRQINIERAPKGSANFPFPLVFERKIPIPESAAMWDVDEICVRLKLANKDAVSCPVAVQVRSPLLPKKLRKAIAETLEQQWKKDLAAGGGAWFLDDILSWAEAKYSDLLQLVPEYINRYDTGFSEIRYAIQEPQEESEDEIDPEERARLEAEAEAAAEEWERKEMEKLLKAAEKKDAEAAEKRKAKEDGLDSSIDGAVEGGKKILSKKQMDALHAAKKANKNARMAKAPSKSHKPTGEGSKAEAAKSKKEKKLEEQGISISQLASRQMGNQRK